MRHLAQFVSVIFHPLLILTYALALLILINPYLFGRTLYNGSFPLLFTVFVLSFLFPLVSILLMKGIGLLSSFEMEDKKERIGPLIVTIIFYIWIYLNIRTNPNIPDALRFFILGSTISLSLAFIINTVSKISLHTTGMGGLFAGFLIIRYSYTYDTFVLTLWDSIWSVHSNLLLLFLIFFCGLAGTSRLYLGAHTNNQVYVGYIIGILSMLVSYTIVIA